MKDNYYYLNGTSDNYGNNLEKMKKNISKIHSTNENLTYNLINRTQSLLDNSFNIIKNHSKGNIERLKEFSSISNNDVQNNKSNDLFTYKQNDQSNYYIILGKVYDSYEITKREVFKSTNRTSKIDVKEYLNQLECEVFEKNKVLKTLKLSSIFEGLYHEFNDLSMKKDKLKMRLVDANNFISALKSELERKTAEKKDNCLCDLKKLGNIKFEENNCRNN